MKKSTERGWAAIHNNNTFENANGNRNLVGERVMMLNGEKSNWKPLYHPTESCIRFPTYPMLNRPLGWATTCNRNAIQILPFIIMKNNIGSSNCA